MDLKIKLRLVWLVCRRKTLFDTKCNKDASVGT
jgi:hypothetical protein